MRGRNRIWPGFRWKTMWKAKAFRYTVDSVCLECRGGLQPSTSQLLAWHSSPKHEPSTSQLLAWHSSPKHEPSTSDYRPSTSPPKTREPENG